MSHNSDLYKAFTENSLGKFVEALEVFEADLNAYPENETRTLFEIILNTPDSASFIEKCIEYGADFYVKNSNHTYPIHYVVESKCIKNVEAVFKSLLKSKQHDSENTIKSSSYVNVKNKNDQNCLHLLAKSLNDENNEKIVELMCTLLSYGCNINSPNDEQETPFYIVARELPHLKNGQEIFNKLLENAEIDFYTHKGDEIVKFVKNKYIEVMPEKKTFVVCYEEMKKLLETGDINKFETLFSCYRPSEDNETFHNNCYSYMEIAVEKSYINIVDLLIKKRINFNKTSVENKTGIPPPFQAYENANVEIFKSFLLASLEISGNAIDFICKNKECENTLFHQFFSNMKGSGTTTKSQTIEMTTNQKKCFDLLINDPRCKPDYLNALDKDNKPVIYYSVGYGIDYMTLKLLEKGAFIGRVVTKIRKCLLNEFLDSCINSNDKFNDDDSFHISINYGFLMPTLDVLNAIKNKEQKKDARKPKNNEQKPNDGTMAMSSLNTQPDIEENAQNPNRNNKKYAPEMWALKLLANNPDYKQFVMHPVLSSFVFLKWKKIRFSLHINLLITLFFIFSFIPFIMISRSDQQSLIYKIFFGLSFTSLIILSCRETLQCLQSKRRYFKCYSNYIDLVMIISSFVVLFRIPLINHHFRMLHTVIILLATWEYFNLLGYLPLLSVSLHTKMFRKVFTTFIKSLSFYSVMIIGFALAFYTMHGDKALTMKNSETNNQSSTDPDSLNNFASLRFSIVKSFVMMIGELDAGSIYLEGYTYIALFMLFLFIVTIVLYNLLNALAVSDTQAIRSDAKLIDLRQRILMMYKHEKYAFRITWDQMGSHLQKIILLFPETLAQRIIYLKPNVGRDTFSNKDCKTPIQNEWLPSILCYFGKGMTMDKEIIQDMCTLLVKKSEEKNEQKMGSLKEKRSEKMAYDIIKINDDQKKFKEEMIRISIDDQKQLKDDIKELKELIYKSMEQKKSENMIDLL